MQQLVVTGKYADGTVRDLTPFASYVSESADLLDATNGFVRGKRNGNSQLTVQVGGQSAKVPVAVTRFDEPRRVSFRHDVIAALNVGGCNAGACHGTPSGKNGFKLSLRGYDPPPDYVQLTRDVLGRRTDRHDPDASLILQKALGRVPHEGGARFGADSVPAEAITGWLGEGLQDDPTDLPAVQKDRSAARHARAEGAGPLAAAGRPGHLRRRREPRRDPPDRLHQQRPGHRRRQRRTAWSSSGRPARSPSCAATSKSCEAVRLTYLEPRAGFVWTNPPENNYVDKHVFAKLKMLTILPSDLCTDQEFVRRAYLDLCGVLPTAEEVDDVPRRQGGRTSGPS